MTSQFIQETAQNPDGYPGVLNEKVVKIRRVAKVVKGGRHLSFSALVVAGDGQGRVGTGLGKAVAIPDAVRKGVYVAQKTLIQVPIVNDTISHTVEAKYGGALVLVKPAPSGTGIIAGASMRAVLEMAGIRDVVTKSKKSQNPINVVRATIKALEQLSAPQHPNPTSESNTDESIIDSTPIQSDSVSGED